MHEIISRKKQNHWQWQAVLNFFLGGTGAGLYIIGFFSPINTAWEESIISASHIRIISPALVLAGMLAVATEAGRPSRGMLLFANISRSWMSREIMFALIFIVFSFLGFLIKSSLLSFATAVAAALFVISQAMILYCSSAVPSWNQRILPLFFISSALLNGFGLFLLLSVMNLYNPASHAFYPLKISIVIYGIICICLTSAIWFWMVCARSNQEIRRAFHHFCTKRMFITGVVIAGLIPLLSLIGFAAQINSQKIYLALALSLLSSTSILFSGYYRLYHLVLNVDYLRPVSFGIDKPAVVK